MRSKGISNPVRRLLSLKVMLVMPVQVILFFLVIVPTILVIWFSVTDYHLTFGVDFWNAKIVGLMNFMRILNDMDFIYALSRTISIAVLCTLMEFALALLLCLLLSREFAGKGFFYALLIIPLMIPPIVVANTFWLLFTTNGPINQIVSWFLGTDFRVSWFSSPSLAAVPIILSEVWHWYPLTFLILYAGMTGVSLSELRAAEILGASDWQIFWRIQFPKIKQVIGIALVIRLMEALKVFDPVYLLTQGGPGTLTETISYFLFKHGYFYGKIAYISAGAWIVLFICLISFSLAFKYVILGGRGEKG